MTETRRGRFGDPPGSVPWSGRLGGGRNSGLRGRRRGRVGGVRGPVVAGDFGFQDGVAFGEFLESFLEGLGLRADGAAEDLAEVLGLAGGGFGLPAEEGDLPEHENAKTAREDEEGREGDLQGEAERLEFALGGIGAAEGGGGTG